MVLHAPKGLSDRVDLFDHAMETLNSPPDSSVVATSATQTLTLDAGGVVRAVNAVITLYPPGWVTVKQVAELRPGPTSDQTVIDFGRMRTVTGVDSGSTQTIANANPWQGASFAVLGLVDPESTATHATWGETVTERLLVKTGGGALAATALVNLPGGPTDIELLVAGKRVWFQAGEAKQGALNSDPVAGAFVANIDITDAIAAAARDAAAKSSARSNDIVVELRTATSGQIQLALDATTVRIYPIDFPGAQKVVALAAEGTATLPLPMLTAAHTWLVAGVSFTASAKLDEVRVLPAVGPALATDAELIVDTDHPIALQATADAVTTFGKLAGVRVLARVDAGIAELGGALLADDGGQPGAPLPGGDLVPAPLAAGPAAWCSLLLRKPIAAPAGPVWVSLQSAQGTIAIALGVAGGGVLRGKPGGPWRGFSKAVNVQPTAALRLVGIAPDTSAIDALSATFHGETAQFTPTADGVAVNIAVETFLLGSAPLSIALEATAAASYQFANVQVFYKLGEGT